MPPRRRPARRRTVATARRTGTTTRKRTTKKVVVGFVVADRYHDEGQFVKTVEEASAWLDKKGYSVDDYGDGAHIYAVDEAGNIKCCEAKPAGVKIELPSTMKYAPKQS